MKYRYTLHIGDQSREVTPTNLNGAVLNYTPGNDNRFAYYPRFRKKIVLRDEDFKFVYAFEQSTSRCNFIEMDIEQQCNNVWIPYQVARISLNEAEFDPDRCEVMLELKIKSQYDCYDDNKKIEVNLFEKISTLRTAKFVAGTVEFVNYTSLTGRDFFKAGQFPEASPETKGWTLYYYRKNGANYEYGYAREKRTVNCSESYSADWIVLTDNCPTNKVLVRPVLIVNKEYLGFDTVTRPPRDLSTTDDFPGTLFNGKILGQDVPQIDNGFLLSDVLGWFSNEYCLKPIKSEFFQINPDSPFLTTYPTFPNKTSHNLLFQKSDVKRPDDFNNATKASTTWERFINALCRTYNLRYEITESHFRIEHVSWFSRVIGLDTTIDRYKSFFQSAKYSYLNEEMPEQEVISMMEQGLGDFKGLPITYGGACFTKGKTNSISTEIFTTDVQYVLDNGVRDENGDDSGKVDDAGFVPMACELIGSDYYVLREAPVLDTKIRVNNPLAWAQLHRDYWKWERPQKNGFLNGVLTSFNSSLPTKKGEKITIPFCCDESLKLTDFVKTKIGDAIIGEANFNLYANTLEILPLYRSDAEVFICQPPVSFVFDHREDAVFFFNTVFADAGSYNVEVQWSKDGGVWTTLGTFTETNGTHSYDLGTVTAGTYSFRKRVICAFEQSEYSPSTSATVPPTTCDGTPPPFTLHQYNSSTGRFTFQTPFFVPANGIEIEVNRPDGVTYVNTPFNISSGGGMLFVIVSKDKIPFTPAPNSGLYRFRFRWVCAPGVVGEWSSPYLDVTI